MNKLSRVERLEQAIKLYEQTIVNFEGVCDRLRVRRSAANDSVMVIIDERLALHERTLTSLKKVLATTEGELRRARDEA